MSPAAAAADAADADNDKPMCDCGVTIIVVVNVGATISFIGTNVPLTLLSQCVSMDVTLNHKKTL